MQNSLPHSLIPPRKYALPVLVLLGLFLITSCSLFQDGGQIISPEGGILEFSDGIQMVIPPNAVSEETIIHLIPIDNAEVADILEDALIPLQPITFFQVSLENGNLQNPVTVILPIEVTDKFIGIPIHVEIDLDTGTVKYPPTNLAYDPEAGTIELSLDSFSTHGIGKKREMEGPTECKNPVTACRCGAWISESRALDYSFGDCQSITSEINTQFLDCPGQPIEKDKESERTPDCEWKGSVSYHYSFQIEGMDMEVNCSNPIPFKIGEDDTLNGSGSIHCVLNQDLGEGGHLDLAFEQKVVLSGNFDGFELNFDPPVEKVIDGQIKIWAMVEGSEVTLVDATFDDKQASADLLVYPEATLFSFIVPIEIDEKARSAYNFKFPLEDGSVYDITIPGDGSHAILTLTLNLDVK